MNIREQYRSGDRLGIAEPLAPGCGAGRARSAKYCRSPPEPQPGSPQCRRPPAPNRRRRSRTSSVLRSFGGMIFSSNPGVGDGCHCRPSIVVRLLDCSPLVGVMRRMNGRRCGEIPSSDFGQRRTDSRNESGQRSCPRRRAGALAGRVPRTVPANNTYCVLVRATPTVCAGGAATPELLASARDRLQMSPPLAKESCSNQGRETT